MQPPLTPESDDPTEPTPGGSARSPGRESLPVGLDPNEPLYRVLVERAHGALMLVDGEDGRCLLANPAAQSLTGHPLNRLLDMRLAELVTTMVPAGVGVDDLTQLRRAGELCGDRRLIRADGSSIVVDFVAVAEVVPGRHLIELRDVTARDRAAKQTAHAERLRSVGELAGGIAHDFNNVMSIILNYSRFLLEQVDDAAMLADIGEIHAAAERASALTRQLLIFSRRDPNAPVSTNLRDAVTEIIELLDLTLGDDIEVALRSADPAALVFVDPAQLEQVMLNLATNAREAMPDGGELTIDVSRSPGRDEAVLVFSDTGKGMSEDVMAHAFDPFFTTKTRGGGSGLGLATVHGIVTGAGGRVWLSSELGRGTRVSIVLPLAEPAPDRAIAPAGPPASDAAGASLRGGRRVLVVDDDDHVREVVRRILTGAGYEVIAVGGGEQALDTLQTVRVDLVLSDIVMPRMDGIRLAELLRAGGAAPPIVFMSGYSDRGPDAVRHEQLISKPFDGPHLIEFVGAILRSAAG